MVVCGFKAGEVCVGWGWALSRLHVATLTQPLAVSRRSGLFATMSGIRPTAALFAPPVAQELAPTPGQTGGLKAVLSVPGAKWWASVSSVLY